MPYDPDLLARLQVILAGEPGLIIKKMFGGYGFMLGGNMACGCMSDGGLIVRAGLEESVALATRPHAALMEQRGKPMRGWLIVGRDGWEKDADLRAWVAIGVAHARGLPVK
jgi:hypothetical protein